MESLINKYRRLVSATGLQFRRGLYGRINWKAKAICIEGARGTGKSTLMLQHIKDVLPLDRALYLSLDDLYFRQHALQDVAEAFYAGGGRHLYLDEVHKYPDWQTAVKNIYDFFPDLQLVISGSSVLELQKSRADLSRRLLRYHLPELSLREYISLKKGIGVPAFTLDRLLTDHAAVVDQLSSAVPSPLQLFREYLTYGAYPFFIEGEDDYLSRINELINVIIDYDLPEAKAIEVSTQGKLKLLLYIISTLAPYIPNISKLAEQTGVTRHRLLEMLQLLEKARLIHNLRASAHGISLMNKPEKIFLRNTSLIAALAEGGQDKGNLRETFFLMQLTNSGFVVTYPKKGDFLIDKKFLFEVGGKNKTLAQIAGQENAFLAVDDIEYGNGNRIPLWLFGFLY